MKISKKEFFKRHNPLFIDKETKPNWQNNKYKYFVIEHSQDYKYVIVLIYTTEPFMIKTVLLYMDNEPIEEFTSLEAAYTMYKILSKGEKIE